MIVPMTRGEKNGAIVDLDITGVAVARARARNTPLLRRRPRAVFRDYRDYRDRRLAATPASG